MLDNASLNHFFSEAIGQARANHQVDLSDHSTHYLSQLLASRGRPTAPPADTLAELHMSAAQAPRGRALMLYRELGDQALYIGGFFPESLESKAVGVDYYRSMGGAAYGRVASLGGPLAQMFHELAQRFEDCLRLLGDVAEAARAANTRDLIALYERWLANPTPHATRRLAQLGMLDTQGAPEAS